MEPSYIYRASLHRIVDGDTYELMVDLGFRVMARLMVRLRDYNAPELREKPKGLQAAQAAEHLLSGRPLTLQSHKDQQSFARWVADVWFLDDAGEWRPVGETLAEKGWMTRIR